MKIFRDLKTNKKSIIIWTLMIFAIGTMIQSGAGATAMAFNGRHYDFFDLNFNIQDSGRSGRQHFDRGLRFSGFGDDDNDRGGRPGAGRRTPSIDFVLADGQSSGWDGDFDIVNVPGRSRRRDHDDRGSRRNYRVWEFQRLDGDCEPGDDCPFGDDASGDDDCDYYTTGDGDSGTMPPVSTPEPATLLLLGGGLLGLAGFKKRHF